MIKASALYIVIIIALVIGVLCSALIFTALLYKSTYQKKFRYDRLENNLQSGVNILLAANDTSMYQDRSLSLFGGTDDSIHLKKIFWGAYDIGVSECHIQNDTLAQTFSIASAIDSAKWAALYLIDEDRMLSVSGKTTIRGSAFLPKAGIKEAFVDNTAYQGDKRLVIGEKRISAKQLPVLDTARLRKISRLFIQPAENGDALLKMDSLTVAYRNSTRYFNFKKTAVHLSRIKLSGNIVLLSDTTLTIDSTAQLNNIIVFAQSVKVSEGFHGKCQLFALDSISVAKNCRFVYPSCIATVRIITPKLAPRCKISIGNKATIFGSVFTYEKTPSKLQPLVQLAANVQVSGQLYSQDVLELHDQDEIDGSVFTSRFLYEHSFTVFENYLINATVNSKALSPYYLTSSIFPVSSKKNKILQWLGRK